MIGSLPAGVSPRGEAVPTPEVVGPIEADPAGSPGRNYPFLQTDVDLGRWGYVADEFFYSGTANWYDAPVPTVNNDPAPPTAKIRSKGHPYTTRMMVYRPTDSATFTGTVFVEWTNSTGFFDNPVWWQRNHEYLLRAGHAYVGIAAQYEAVHSSPNGLKHWSPERYAALDIPWVSDTSDVFGLDDHLTYDIFAQGMKAVRAVPQVMGGLDVRHLIAGGHSRSAIHLAVYVNAIHPRAPVVDGVILLICGGQVRHDLDIPVMKILTESEWDNYGGAFVSGRQPDTDRFRTWWITGTSHVDAQSRMIDVAVHRRDLPDLPVQELPAWGAADATPALCRTAAHAVISAGMDAMVRWIDCGTPPPHSPLPEWTPTRPPTAVRDKHRNAKGGIRLATLAVPTATEEGTNPGPYGFQGNFGVHVPFETATLNCLYPSHDAYVEAVTEAAERNVRDGFLLPQDAAEMIANARNSLVGTGLVFGSLCVDVSEFSNQTSTSNLRKHTQIYHFHDGDQLLGYLDEATKLLAEGYTAGIEQSDLVTQAQRFRAAIPAVQRYMNDVETMAPDRAAPETVSVLVDYASTLIARIAADAADIESRLG